ncbi:hypothetical protein RYX36_018334 [Vicia faba]
METIGLRAGLKRKVLTPRRLTKKSQSVQRFSTLCRLYGIGYRLLGKLNHTKSSTVLWLKAIWLKAKLPFELWLGQCCPVDPYLKGRLIWKLQQAFRPKDLVVPPTSTYKSETF